MCHCNNKKFELMLTRRAKVYSSWRYFIKVNWIILSLQPIFLPQIFLAFVSLVCDCAGICMRELLVRIFCSNLRDVHVDDRGCSACVLVQVEQRLRATEVWTARHCRRGTAIKVVHVADENVRGEMLNKEKHLKKYFLERLHVFFYFYKTLDGCFKTF